MNIIKLALLTSALSFGCMCSAQTGLEVMQKNKDCVNFSSLKSSNTLTIKNKNGQTRIRKINRIESIDEKDNKSMLVTFTYPADVEGTGLLSIEKTNDRWLYIPALRQTRRIPSSDISNSFIGTDFSYEDLENESLPDFKYENMGIEQVDGKKCYHIVATPQTPKKIKESGYSKRDLYVTTDKYSIPFIKFYDKKGKLIKELRCEDFRKVKNSNKCRFYKMTMYNKVKKTSTTIDVENYEYDIKLSPNTFTKRSLEQK